MRDVAIIGAGELGGSLAHVLARRDAVRAIRIVDGHGRVAEGKALDIAQSAPIESFATAVSGGNDLILAAGADVVVVADAAGGGEWSGDEGLTLVRRLLQIAPESILLFAGAGHRDLVERGARELHARGSRLLGTAPEAFSAGARAMVALEANASPADVALTIVGNPPHQVVLAWEETTVGGFASTRVLDEPARRRIAARLPALWPPGAYALAAAAAKAIEAIAGRSRRTIAGFVVPDAGSGRRTRTTALPVRLGPSGVEQVIVPQLNAHDRVVLENAMML